MGLLCKVFQTAMASICDEVSARNAGFSSVKAVLEVLIAPPVEKAPPALAAAEPAGCSAAQAAGKGQRVRAID